MLPRFFTSFRMTYNMETIFNKEFLDGLLVKAAESPRLRQNYDLRTSEGESHLLNCPAFGNIEIQSGKCKNRNKADNIPMAVSAPTGFPFLNDNARNGTNCNT